ncbi:MAG: hypothetical protein AAF564_17245 [Bacteroidota bacterium]
MKQEAQKFVSQVKLQLETGVRVASLADKRYLTARNPAVALYLL